MQPAVLGLIAMLFHAPLCAHSLGESYGVLRAGPDAGSYTVTYNMRRDQFLQLADPRYFADQAPLAIVAAEVRDRYRLYAGDVACEKTRLATLETGTFLQASFVATCPADAPVELRNHAFLDLLPDHLHFVRVSTADGGFAGERVLDRAHRSWVLPAVLSATLPATALRYARLGTGHMILGFDHLAFLASILLLVAGLKPLVFVITGFFGLIHGFGFAGSLLEIGLPVDRLAVALLVYNLGIELGQVLLIGALLAILLLMIRIAPSLTAVRVPSGNILASALVALGMFWFVDRAFL